jgi:hypothetical protein
VKANELSFNLQTGRKDLVFDANIGPGSYENGADILNSAGEFTIGVRREVAIPISVGPGTYEIEKADQTVF